MREGSPAAAVILIDLFAGLAQTARVSSATCGPGRRALEGQAQGAPAYNYSKRVGSRLLRGRAMLGETAGPNVLRRPLFSVRSANPRCRNARVWPRFVRYTSSGQERVDYGRRLGSFFRRGRAGAHRAARRKMHGRVSGGNAPLSVLAEQSPVTVRSNLVSSAKCWR